jgi:hypothetical protein
MFWAHRTRIADLAAHHRLPAIYGVLECARAPVRSGPDPRQPALGPCRAPSSAADPPSWSRAS